MALLYIFHWWFLFTLLLSGDIEKNPGPESSLVNIMHWNLNSILAHNGIRVPLIQSYNLLHNYDFIALTETALTNLVSNEAIRLEGFTPIRSDLPANITHDNIIIYHNDRLPVQHRPDLQTHDNTVVCQVTLDKKKLSLLLPYIASITLLNTSLSHLCKRSKICARKYEQRAHILSSI